MLPENDRPGCCSLHVAAAGDAAAAATIAEVRPPSAARCALPPILNTSRLKLQLEDHQEEAAEALQQQADCMAARLEAAATAAAEHTVQRWAAEALPPLLQPMQEAVAATADLAASLAAEVAGLAGRVGQLADRCSQLEAAHANHEQRLCHAEECSLEASGGGGPASLQQLEALGQHVQSLQEGHALLDEAMQGLRQQAATAAHQAAAAVQQAAAVAASPQPPTSWQSFPAAALSPEMEAAAAELPSLQRQVAALADQQAQQAGSAEVLQSGECGLEVAARRDWGLHARRRWRMAAPWPPPQHRSCAVTSHLALALCSSPSMPLLRSLPTRPQSLPMWRRWHGTRVRWTGTSEACAPSATTQRRRCCSPAPRSARL